MLNQNQAVTQMEHKGEMMKKEGPKAPGTPDQTSHSNVLNVSLEDFAEVLGIDVATISAAVTKIQQKFNADEKWEELKRQLDLESARPDSDYYWQFPDSHLGYAVETVVGVDPEVAVFARQTIFHAGEKKVESEWRLIYFNGTVQEFDRKEDNLPWSGDYRRFYDLRVVNKSGNGYLKEKVAEFGKTTEAKKELSVFSEGKFFSDSYSEFIEEAAKKAKGGK